MFYKNNSDGLVAATVLPGARFAVGEQRALFSITTYESYWNWRDYDVSPDGSRFVMIRRASQSRDELIFVENYFDELTAKVKR